MSIALFLSLSLGAQTVPKAADYREHARLAGVEIGARYLAPGAPSGSGVYGGKEFLVVEVGVFPEKTVSVSKSEFSLSVDGKTPLTAQSPGSSGGSALARNSSPQSGSVELGGPPLTARPSGSAGGVDAPVRQPIRLAPEASADATRKTALPEGSTARPVSGYLYFPYAGDPKSIRSLELMYDGGNGAKVKLRIL